MFEIRLVSIRLGSKCRKKHNWGLFSCLVQMFIPKVLINLETLKRGVQMLTNCLFKARKAYKLHCKCMYILVRKASIRGWATDKS